MKSQRPTPPNDNPHLNDDGQPISPNTNLNRSDNFVDTTEEGLFDFDLEDLENFFNANLTSPAQSPASTPHVEPNSQPLPALDLTLTSLETHAGQAHTDHTAPTHTGAAINLEKSLEIPLPDETPSPEIISTPAPTNETKSPTPSEPVTLNQNIPTSSLAGTSTGGADNHYTPLPILTAMKKPNKNNKPLLIVLGLLGVGTLAWLASHFLSEPEPSPAQQPIPAPKTVSATADSPPNSAVTATSGTVAMSAPTVISSPAVTAASGTAASSPLTMKTINPKEILATPLPKDNAVAKEEIDRLADQSKQLSQQEKMMEEQLKMMNELSSKKEERIALLEKQIAQIEAQKGQAKK